MKPVNQFLEVSPISANEKIGSVFLPGNTNVTHKRGIIKSFSDQLKGLEVGQTIIYFKRGIVAEFPERGTEFLRFDQILCVE